jgi:hypothetical protein
MTWCVARAEHTPKWLSIFIIFNSSTWLLIAIIFLLMTKISYLFANNIRQSNDNFLWSIFNTLSLTINNFDYMQSKRLFFRIFIAFSLYYGIHIGTAYRSLLIDVLTRPRYEKQVDNVRDALAKSYTFTGNINILNFTDQDEVYKSTVKTIMSRNL